MAAEKDDNTPKEDLSESIDLTMKLDKLLSEVGNSLASHAATQKEINSLVEAQLKFIKEIQDESKKKGAHDSSSEQSSRRMLSNEEKLRNLRDEALDIAKEYAQNIKVARVNTDSMTPSVGKLGKNQLALVELQGKQAIAAATFLETLTDENKLQQLSKGALKEIISFSKRYVDLTSSAKTIQDSILKQSNDVIKGNYQSVSLQEQKNSIRLMELDLTDLIEKKTKTTSDSERVALEGRIADMTTQLDIATNLVQSSEQLNATYATAAKRMQEVKKVSGDISKGVGKSISSVSTLLGKLPGGSHLSKALNIEGIAGKVESKLGGALDNVLGKLGPGATGMLGKFALIGGVVGGLAAGAFAFLVHNVMELDSHISEVGKTFGVSRKEAAELHHQTVEIANDMNLVGLNSKEVLSGIKATSEVLGGLSAPALFKQDNPAIKQLVKDTTVLTEKFGMSNEEVASLHSLSVMTGKSMGELTMETSTLNKGLFSSKDALKMMASLPKSVVVAFKGGTQELIKAAAKAKMLGMELGKVQDIGDGMLDIEASLGKEMEARALTGKDLNLDAARYFALTGDVASLQDEILNQAGSLEEFQNMNRIQQKSFADAMGMSVDEMTNMLTNAQKLKDIGMSSARAEELQAKNAEELNAIAAKTGDEKQKSYIQELAKQKEVATAQQRLQDVISKIQEKLQSFLTPVVEFVHSLLDGAAAGEKVGGIFGTIGTIFEWVKKIVGGIFTVIGGILSVAWELLSAVVTPIFQVFSEIQTVVSQIWTALSAAFEPLFGAKDETSEMVDFMGIFKTVIGEAGKILGTVIVRPISLIAGLISGVIKLFTGDFNGAIDSIGKTVFEFFFGIPKIITGVIDKIFGTDLTGKIDGMMQWFSDAFRGIGEFFKPILTHVQNVGSAIWKFIKAPFDLISGVVSGVIDIFSGDFVGGLRKIGKSILDYITAPFRFVWDLVQSVITTFTTMLSSLGSVGEAIANFILTPFNLVRDAVNMVIDAFKSIIDTVMNIGGAIIEYITDPIGSVGSLIGGLFGGGDEGEEETTKKQESAADKTKSAGGASDVSVAVPVQGAASGGIAKSSGLAIVGENGPEIVSLPQSANIASSPVTAQMSSVAGALMGSTSQSPSPDASTSKGGGEKDKMDQVISLLSQIVGAANQPTVIKFGDKTVEEIKTQLNFKKAYSVGVDNTYGRSV